MILVNEKEKSTFFLQKNEVTKLRVLPSRDLSCIVKNISLNVYLLHELRSFSNHKQNKQKRFLQKNKNAKNVLEHWRERETERERQRDRERQRERERKGKRERQIERKKEREGGSVHVAKKRSENNSAKLFFYK